MDVMRNKVTIVSIMALVFVAIVMSIPQVQQQIIPQPSNEVFIKSITETFPEFTDDKKPFITVRSTSRHENAWYIVTIGSTKKVDTVVPVKIIMKDALLKDPVVILGPDTYFDKETLTKNDIPESVIEELQKS